MEILKRFGDKDDIGQIEVIIYNLVDETVCIW